MERPKGMHPLMFSAYIRAFFKAGIDPENAATTPPKKRITQLIGNAPASHGVHKADGTFMNENGEAEAYGAAIDIQIKDLEFDQHIKPLLIAMAENGFCPYHRHTGSFAGANRHIHAVYCAVHMKSVLADQVDDWLVGKNGLATHTADDFWKNNGLNGLALADLQELRNHNKMLFSFSNPDHA